MQNLCPAVDVALVFAFIDHLQYNPAQIVHGISEIVLPIYNRFSAPLLNIET